MVFANEYNLLHQASDLLALLIQIQVQVMDELEPSPAGMSGWLQLKNGGETLRLNALCKQQLPAGLLQRVVAQVQSAQTQTSVPALVVAPYVPPAQALALREAGFFYLDLKGNLYLRWGEREFWFVQAARALGKKFPAQPVQKVETLTAAGARLVYVLLSDPTRVQWPMRDLAELAGIAAGSVKMTFDWLERHNFVRSFGRSRGRSLVSRSKLLGQWVSAYADRLRPKLWLGRYAIGHGFEQTTKHVDRHLIIQSFPIDMQVWGGEFAASHLTGMDYRSDVPQVLYVQDRRALNRLLAQKSLIPSAGECVDILLSFWRPEDRAIVGMAPPLVVYAELMNSPNSRSWEAAGMIHDRYLKDQLSDARVA